LHLGAISTGAINLRSDTATLVQGFALFSGVSPSDCASIVSTAREKRFLGRQVIFAEGAPVRQILLLLSGCVKVTQIGLSGDEVILKLNGPGDIVGAFGLCARCDHCSTAQTLQPSTSLVWEAANFASALDRFPLLRRNVTRTLEERLREMEERFREVSTEKVGSRLSSELIRLSKHVGRSINGAVEISLSRSDLAQMTGTTLFTVSRLLCQWKSLGIVSVRREGVLLRNVEALAQLSQSE
jgi:CRP/FNR family transcriptional regulator, nitrogen oxide reductase regulator